jgi:predicted permease
VEIFNILGPIFMLIALGSALQRAGFFGGGFLNGANKLTYWVGLPALILVSLMKADHSYLAVGRLLLTLILATLLSAGLAWVTARAVGVKQGAEGTWAQAAFRGNLTFVGLPLILTTPGLPVASAMLSLAPLLVVYNGLSVSALLLSRHRGADGISRMVVKEIARNPIVVASIAGAAAYLIDLQIWLPIDRSIEMISRMAVPLALVCIGGALVVTPYRGNRRGCGLCCNFQDGRVTAHWVWSGQTRWPRNGGVAGGADPDVLPDRRRFVYHGKGTGRR